MKNILNVLKKDNVVYILEFLALIAVVVPLFIIVCSNFIAEKLSYNINIYLVSRLIGFIALIASVVTFKYINKISLKYCIKDNFLTSICSLSFISFATILVALVLYKQSLFNYKINSWFFLSAILYCTILGWGLMNRIINLNIKSIYVSLSIVIVTFYVLTLPYLTPSNLNSESYPNPIEIDFLKSQITNTQPNKNLDKHFILADNEVEIVKTNIEKIKLSRLESKIGFYSLDGNRFEWQATRNNLTSLCLLAQYNKTSIYRNLNDCVLEINNDKSRLNHVFSELSFVNNNIARYVFEVLRLSDLSSKDIQERTQSIHHLNIMLVKGGVFHHYNSILQTLNSSTDIKDLFFNQYGFGSLFIVRTIEALSGLSSFDSLFNSIIIVNFSIAALLFAVSWKKPNNWVIWLGFILSIYVTYSISNVLAPFLYFIRYLPTIFLCIYLYNLSQNKVSTLAKDKLFNWIIITTLISFYNFEYAILTLSAVIVVSWYWNKKNIFLTALVGLFIASATKILPTKTYNASQTNYLEYLAGIGMGAEVGVITLIFLSILGVVIYIKKYELFAQRESEDFPQALLLTLTVFLSVKVLWNGSANHIGPLFLILSLAICSDSKKKIIDIVYFRKFFIFSSSIIILIATLYSKSYYYNTSYKGTSYSNSELSEHFRVSSSLLAKVISFQSIYSPGYLLLSPIDNTLSLFSKKKMTGNSPDISSNLNIPSDVTRVIQDYVAIHSPIVIDKAIIDKKTLTEISYEFRGLSAKSDDFISDYLANNYRFNQVYESILHSGYFECDKNPYFIVICPPKDN